MNPAEIAEQMRDWLAPGAIAMGGLAVLLFIDASLKRRASNKAQIKTNAGVEDRGG